MQGSEKLFGHVETFLMLVFSMIIAHFVAISGAGRILQLMILILSQ